MQTDKKYQFNPIPSHWMHIDLNSCFATIEQQANPLLRGKPIAVAAYQTPHGCILAPSVEAKRFGVKTGMRVMDGKKLCPQLIVLGSDPPKYRFVNRVLLKLLSEYCAFVSVRSIDEMVLDFTQSPPSIFKNHQSNDFSQLKTIGKEIKTRIKSEIGDWLTVSIGISTNPYLAKLAAGLHKPDGLDEINQSNILTTLSGLKLTDLPYIKERNEIRLNRVGIKTPLDFYLASPQQLKAAFQSINGHYWHLRLHGQPIDEIEWQRRSIGHEYSLPRRTQNLREIEQLLCKLVEKVGRRLRSNNFTARGLHLGLRFNNNFWHKGHKFPQPMYTSQDLFSASKLLLNQALPLQPVRLISITCFALEENANAQLRLFDDEVKKYALTQALDQINDRWGEFAVIPGTMLSIQRQNKILDRISFGRVLDIQDVVLNEQQNWERQAFFG